MQKLLEVTGLKKTFYKNKMPVTAVDHIRFDVVKGECLGLVGESGCGKSTTAKIITHLTVPDAGSALLHGEETLYLRGKKNGRCIRRSR